MKKLVLHIGPPKTGSTALQNFLLSTEGILHQHGILYPLAGRLTHGQHVWLLRAGKREKVSGVVPSHYLLGYAVRGWVEDMDPDAQWRELAREIRQSDADLAVVSAEVFGNLDADAIERIGAYLEEFEVTVLTYAREPFARLLSQYTQTIKTGKHHRTFEQFLRQKVDSIAEQYTVSIEHWRRVFGQSRVIVKVFDDIVAKQGLESDFLHTLGLDPADFPAQLAALPPNQSPRPEAIRLIRVINLLEHSIGTPLFLERVFRRARNGVASLNRDTTAGAPLGALMTRLLGRPLWTEDDRNAVEKAAGSAYRNLLHNGAANVVSQSDSVSLSSSSQTTPSSRPRYRPTDRPTG